MLLSTLLPNHTLVRVAKSALPQRCPRQLEHPSGLASQWKHKQCSSALFSCAGLDCSLWFPNTPFYSVYETEVLLLPVVSSEADTRAQRGSVHLVCAGAERRLCCISCIPYQKQNFCIDDVPVFCNESCLGCILPEDVFCPLDGAAFLPVAWVFHVVAVVGFQQVFQSLLGLCRCFAHSFPTTFKSCAL
ncbi:MAG: uncharacterized protein A8A55_2264 [Amphiamblys sp. WSBS2006]|nr:MAG: uncharacterized protein A8A55_2264 [Amphiamblys sp. WSBS2006]